MVEGNALLEQRRILSETIGTLYQTIGIDDQAIMQLQLKLTNAQNQLSQNTFLQVDPIDLKLARMKQERLEKEILVTRMEMTGSRMQQQLMHKLGGGDKDDDSDSDFEVEESDITQLKRDRFEDFIEDNVPMTQQDVDDWEDWEFRDLLKPLKLTPQHRHNINVELSHMADTHEFLRHPKLGYIVAVRKGARGEHPIIISEDPALMENIERTHDTFLDHDNQLLEIKDRETNVVETYRLHGFDPWIVKTDPLGDLGNLTGVPQVTLQQVTTQLSAGPPSLSLDVASQKHSLQTSTHTKPVEQLLEQNDPRVAGQLSMDIQLARRAQDINERDVRQIEWETMDDDTRMDDVTELMSSMNVDEQERLEDEIAQPKSPRKKKKKKKKKQTTQTFGQSKKIQKNPVPSKGKKKSLPPSPPPRKQKQSTDWRDQFSDEPTVRQFGQPEHQGPIIQNQEEVDRLNAQAAAISNRPSFERPDGRFQESSGEAVDIFGARQHTQEDKQIVQKRTKKQKKSLWDMFAS